MLTLYTIFSVVGLAIFVIAIFGNFDHSFDFGHDMDFHIEVGGHDFHIGGHDVHGVDSPGLFSIRTVSAFLAGFGVAGLVSNMFWGWGLGGQVLLGFGAGLLMLIVTYFIMKGFYSQQAGIPLDSNELVGKTAMITTKSGDQGIGECRVENKYYTCKEKTLKALLTNESVKVVEAIEGTLIVEKV